MIKFLSGKENQRKTYTEYDLMKYRLANDALGIALWDMDVEIDDPTSPDNKITWSQELRELLGFSDENDFPNTIPALADRFHPDDNDNAFEAFAAHFYDRTGKTPFNIEYRLKHKNGEYRWFQGFGTTLRDGAGLPLKVAGAVMDIDKIKQIEAERTEALSIMEKVLNGLDAIIYVTDPITSEILFMNNTMRRLYQFEDDVNGRICYKVLQRGMDKRCDFCPRYKLDKEPDSVVVWEIADPFTQRVYRKTDRYMKWPDGKTVHLQHSVDITDLVQMSENNKQMTEEVKNALLETQKANRAKDDFMSHMSHEMLTPMNAIIGTTQVIKMRCNPNILDEDLDDIETASRHLLKLINDLLDMTDGKDGAFILVKSAFSFDEMFQGVMKDISSAIGEKQQTISFDIDRAIPPALIGDEKRLGQVISNLLLNANKFTKEHGEIHFSARMLNEENEIVDLQIEVRDNGIGISKEQQKEIFNLFMQVDGGLNRKEGGVGIGLPLSEHIVELMGGKIWVESELEKGTTFTFTCKLKKG